MQRSAAVLSSAFNGGNPERGFDVERLLAPQQAVVAYLARVALSAGGVEYVALDDAAQRILARDAVASGDHPAHARSTMDGYALSSTDGVARRRVAGEIAMGRPPSRGLEAGEAMRVPTGGALPAGADAVVPQEDVTREGCDAIVVHASPRAGNNVTPQGSDIRAGECVLRAGRRLGAAEVGVLAALGIARVPVYVRPRIAIVSTGDELVDPQEAPGAGEVRDSNRYALAASLSALGAQPVPFPRVPDTSEALRSVLTAALEQCDAAITSGGSSVGARDLIPRVVAEMGSPGAVVHGLRVKPGKPTLLAAIGTKPVFGLPGNPASALMILEAVLRPLVARLTGERDARPVAYDASAGEPFAGRPGWTWFVPVRVCLRDGRLHARPLELRSAQTSLLARATGYVTLGEDAAPVAAGELVRVALFASGGAPPEDA